MRGPGGSGARSCGPSGAGSRARSTLPARGGGVILSSCPWLSEGCLSAPRGVESLVLLSSCGQRTASRRLWQVPGAGSRGHVQNGGTSQRGSCQALANPLVNRQADLLESRQAFLWVLGTQMKNAFLYIRAAQFSFSWGHIRCPSCTCSDSPSSHCPCPPASVLVKLSRSLCDWHLPSTTHSLNTRLLFLLFCSHPKHTASCSSSNMPKKQGLASRPLRWQPPQPGSKPSLGLHSHLALSVRPFLTPSLKP